MVLQKILYCDEHTVIHGYFSYQDDLIFYSKSFYNLAFLYYCENGQALIY